MRILSIARIKYVLVAAIVIALIGFSLRVSASFVSNSNSSTAWVKALHTLTSHSASSSAQTVATQASSTPVILYTDITSGPNSGGEHNNGTYLTIFGVHFGAAQGNSTVTIKGQPVAQYLLWSDTKIGVQVGRVSSGPIVVSVAGVTSNSDKMFTVRSGHIYFIGPSVDNSAPGSCSAMTSANSYSAPWGLTNYASKNESSYNPAKIRTPYTYYNCLALGDTLVFLNGVSYPYFDGRGWHASLTPDKGDDTARSFITFMARPGAQVQLGGTGWAMSGVRSISKGYNVYSGLTLTGSGANGGEDFSQHDRVVGNTITCPDCWGPAGAIMGGDGLVLYGNAVHNVSTLNPGGSNKTYHVIYVDGNDIELAWNRIYNTKAYNGIQLHHDGHSGFYNQSFHDNDIADVNGSGINLSTVNPSAGYIKLYNNVIHHVGVAAASDGGGDDPHSCIALKGYGSSTAAGTVEIYNNSMYDCSSYLNVNPLNSSSCAILDFANQLDVTTNLLNNIIYQPAYAGSARQNVFICGSGPAGTLSGSNNIWYSDSAPRNAGPAARYGKIANPLFLSTTNYHLRNGSPAIGAGIAFDGLTSDFDGTPRPNPPAVGAYEYTKADVAASSSPVSKLTPLIAH